MPRLYNEFAWVQIRDSLGCAIGNIDKYMLCASVVLESLNICDKGWAFFWPWAWNFTFGKPTIHDVARFWLRPILWHQNRDLLLSFFQPRPILGA
jgi:hypothetical protein